MTPEESLLANIRTFKRSADLVYGTKDHTSAATLYFKTLFAILDLILLRTQGRMPKDHTERFRMLEATRKDLYDFIDKYFSIYRDTYTQTIDANTCRRLRDDIQALAKREGIEF